LLASFTGETLEDLNQSLEDWIRQTYHRRPHSSTGQSPLERFASHLELIRKPPVDLEDHFRKEVRRRVNKDRSVSIDGRSFEAPTRLIGEQVSLLFHEETPHKVEIMLRGEPQGILVPLDPHINVRIGREQKETTTDKGVRQGQLSFAGREETP